jgi:hypothetical protein
MDSRTDACVKFEHGAVGERASEPLALGRYGPYNRLIHRFREPAGLTGTALRDRLLTDKVMTASGQKPTHALNIVQSWDPQVASIIVLLPVVLSLCIAITWSVVASVVYKADVQASTQTGFTIGSYVVTAGMFRNLHFRKCNRKAVTLTYLQVHYSLPSWRFSTPNSTPVDTESRDNL